MYSSRYVTNMGEEIDKTLEGYEEATIKLDKSLYTQLKNVVKKRNITIKDTMTNLVQNYITREDFFEKFSPIMYTIMKENASIFLKDEKIGKIVEVMVKHKEQDSNDNSCVILYCIDCKSDYCPHTAFATALPELGQLKIKKTN